MPKPISEALRIYAEENEALAAAAGHQPRLWAR